MTKIWKYNNLLLNEKKDHIIRKLQLLSDSEKEEVIRLFDNNPQFENQIDWNKKDSLTFRDFEFLFKKEKDTQIKVNLLGKGVRNLKEGKDYILLGSGTFKGEDWVAVQPLMYYSCRVLASDEVGPDVNARWCIATQNTREHWDRYCIRHKSQMIIVMGESIPTRKVCIEVNAFPLMWRKGSLHFSIWDSRDLNYSVVPKELPKEVFDLLPIAHSNADLVEKYHEEDIAKTKRIQQYKDFEKFKDSLVLNPITKKYDSYSDIDIRLYRDNPYFIKNGKLEIRFGIVDGYFKIGDENEIRTLEGCPERVNTDFKCKHVDTLESLKGCPSSVGEKLVICDCKSLKTLEGISKSIGVYLYIFQLPIENLEGLEDTNVKTIVCEYLPNLKSLKGCPKSVERIIISNCDALESTEDVPSNIIEFI